MGTANQNPVVCAADYGRCVKVTLTNAGAATQVAIDLGHAGLYEVVRIAQTRSGGAGVTHRPFLTTAIGDTTVGTPVYGRILTEAATPVATQINDVPLQPIRFFTSTGVVYFNAGFDAGANNNAITEIYFNVVGGSQQTATN